MLAAIIGAPISAIAYFFLALVSKLQHWLFASLPHELGFSSAPVWWPFPLLFVGGVCCALAIVYLPGTGGHEPADGFKAGGLPAPKEILGVFFAALATLGFGAVLGPEAPLIALGGGLGAWIVSLARRGDVSKAKVVIGATGSFAAVSTLLGSPLASAFLLMEASGLGGAVMELVLIPGLLAAGIGALIFLGLDSWTGLGSFSLAIPGLPHVGSPTGAEFGWALLIGLVAAVIGVAIKRLALLLRDHVRPRRLIATPLAGLVVAAIAVGFSQATGKGVAYVLFSGQFQVGPLVANRATFTLGALLLLLLCKALAYGVSLSSFRGGPVFPSIFIGAAAGVALAHLPGVPLAAGMGIGMGAMMAVMLRLPLTAVLLTTLLLLSDGIAIMPLVIVAVVVAYVAVSWLDPPAKAAPAPSAEPTAASAHSATASTPAGRPRAGSRAR